MRKQLPFSIRLAGGLLLAAALVNGFAGSFTAPAAAPAAARKDRWNTAELDVLASLRLGQLPPSARDPSNAVDGSRAAAALGKQIFNDKRFSRNQAVSCATCHQADKQFQDGLPLSRGIGTGSRRAMPIAGSGHSHWLFWDGRKDSLWSQALGPLEDAVEHGGTRSRYAQLMQLHYQPAYEAIFGSMPDFGSLPQDAGPTGTAAERAAWAAMDEKARGDVNRVFANIGKLIAAYEKTLSHGESRFDRYVEALLRRDASAQQVLLPQEVNGLRVFIGKGQCVTCHNGPLFTDHGFHNTGVPPRDPARPDRGRAAAIAKVQSDEFNCLGRFSDAKPAQCQELRFMVTGDKAMAGAFKTPGLRGVAMRPPYMHAGQFGTLEQVITHYIQAPPAAVGHTELAGGGTGHPERKPIRLSSQEARDLALFLATLSSPIVEGTTTVNSGPRPEVVLPVLANTRHSVPPSAHR